MPSEPWPASSTMTDGTISGTPEPPEYHKLGLHPLIAVLPRSPFNRLLLTLYSQVGPLANPHDK